jgi:hypothetical protein
VISQHDRVTASLTRSYRADSASNWIAKFSKKPEKNDGFSGAKGDRTPAHEAPKSSGESDDPPSKTDVVAIGDVAKAATVVDSSERSNPEGDAIEIALTAALGAAVAAGRFDVVAQLARELEARRLARSKVVDIGSRKRGSK